MDTYSRVHRHFYVDTLPPLLQETFPADAKTLIDLGCGDGSTLYALRAQGRLPPNVIAVDLSADRVARAERVTPGVVGRVGDAAHTGLAPSSADTLVCHQVIEHLPDDKALIAEIARLLTPDGWFYISSVVRESRAWWIYRRDGRWRLDPTHEREYSSTEEFLTVITSDDVEITHTRLSRTRFPIADLVVRGLAATRVLSHDRITGSLAQHQRLRRMTIRPPGYWLVEAVGRRA